MHYLIFFFCFSIFGCKEKTSFESMNYSKLHDEAKNYCETNNFETDYYILIDMSIHSGRNRFFVYNFKIQKNDFEKLITHGSCDVFEENPTLWEKAKFGSKVDSHYSMKGKYSTGKRDYSKWGIHVKYWLNGLEKSNANSIERVTVLHSWEAIAYHEVFPDFAPLSWGCPAFSNEFMTILDVKLQMSTKPVLLWIID